MTEHATGTFTLEDWDEQPYAELDGGTKLTRTSVKQAHEGDVEGSATIESLSFYRTDQTADILGLLRFEGRLGDREGGFVARSLSTFDGTVAKGDLTVLDGSGTGALSGLSGRGEWSAERGPNGRLTLDYELE